MPSAKSKESLSRRMGRWAGRAWRSWTRWENRVLARLAQSGLSKRVAAGLLWIVKLMVLGVLLYTVFWAALLLLAVVSYLSYLAQGYGESDEADGTEWRYGPDGYGLYTSDDYRIDPHDPED